jgi:hypothetical protein
MKKFSSTHVYFILSIIAMIVLGGAYVYFLSSLFQIKNERMVIVEELSNDPTSEIVRGGADRVREYFVIAGEEASFVSFIEGKCSGFGLVCATQSLEESAANPDLASLQIFKMTFRSSGDFPSTMRLLKYLENSEYPITISETNFANVGAWEGVFTISVPVVPR